MLETLGTQQLLDGFAATVSYRLEPDGWATRFPLVLAHLLQGRLETEQAEGALLELDTIAAELRRLTPDKVVWSLDDLRRRDDVAASVDRQASSVYAYFRAEDGRPLIEALREAVLAARATGLSVRVWTPARQRAIVAGLGWATLGLVWLVAGVLFFPRVVLVPGSGGHTGFLLWPQGAVLWVVGLWRAACAFLPALAEWQRRRATLVTLAGAAAWGLLIWATWRG